MSPSSDEEKKAPESKQNLTPVIGAAAILIALFAIYVIVTRDDGGDGLTVGAQMPPPADVGAPPVDAERTSSGLASRVLRAGTGARHPATTSRVEVHYTGWTTDGQMFDSSVMRGEPIEFGLGEVIAGWTEGVKLMVEGEQRRLWIPEALAYRGQEDRPAGMLVFDVELIRIVE